MEVNQDTEQSLRGEVDLDKIVASAMHVNKSRGVDEPHLAKIWRIDHEVAKKTLAITSEHSKHTDNPKLSRNYGTGDQMLCYKRINNYFFMDTFFSTKKGGKSSHGWQHLLPTVCHRQGLHVCRAHAQQVQSPTSSQVVCKGSWSS